MRIIAGGKYQYGIRAAEKFLRKTWLPIQDSNLGKRIQSPLCYRYTNRQYAYGAEGRDRTDMRVAPQWFLRPSRLPIPPLRPVNQDGAEDEIRTRDFLLGKEAFYH